MPIPNQPPTVELTAGPIDGTVTDYRPSFSWQASDPDGRIVQTLVAVDELGPDAWIAAAGESIELRVSASMTQATPDTVDVGEGEPPLLRYRAQDAHTFYVKVIDDDGAESAIASASFTAETLTPETTIEFADQRRPRGPRFHVRWQGVDPDGSEPPQAFSHRLVYVGYNVQEATPAQMEHSLLHPGSAGLPWSEFLVETERVFEAKGPGFHLLGVRAIDEAGAIEPRLRTYHGPGPPNVLIVEVGAREGRPRLFVRGFGQVFSFPGRFPEMSVPSGAAIEFSWEGVADSLAPGPLAYSYGIDLQDPHDESGWSPERPDPRSVELRFELAAGSPPEEHVLYVRVRDSVGTVTIGRVTLHVFDARASRGILYIDDWGKDVRGRAYGGSVASPSIDRDYCTADDDVTGDGTAGLLPATNVVPSADAPADFCHDRHIMAMLEAALSDIGRSDLLVDRHEPLDPDTGRYRDPEVVYNMDPVTGAWTLEGRLSLETLLEYEVVVWNHKSESSSALKSIYGNPDEPNPLVQYLELGGRVWLSGTGTFVRSLVGNDIPGLSAFGVSQEDLAGRYLLQRGSVFDGDRCLEGCFRQSGSNPRFRRENGFQGAIQPASDPWAAEGFPATLFAARLPVAGDPNRGVADCDGMITPFDGVFEPATSIAGGRLDILYFYQSNGALELDPPRLGWMDGAATAMRFAGPDQGPLIMQGFPLFYLPDDEMRRLMAASLRWLLDR